MRLTDNGAFFTVSCSRRDVDAFKRTYPCSGLPDTAIAFQFDKCNGDLVDIFCRKDSASFDGPALVALSEDAQKFGDARRFKTYRLVWSPEGKEIARVVARTPRAAIRKAPKPYSRYRGEIYAEVV